jgi:type III restriction enzyme
MESFFERPILNSPYVYPGRHWELDEEGQPTNRIIDTRRRSELITPVPKPQRRRRTPAQPQPELEFGRDEGLSTADQQYDITRLINEIRRQVDNWRRLPNPNQWQVTPETARLLQHWRHHQFNGVKPFFCQIEAVETAIWLAEVASDRAAAGARLWMHIRGANREANPELLRIALKLATGAGKTTVMAMLIAWQTVNAVRHPGSKNFSRAFLVITPGITRPARRSPIRTFYAR